MGWFSPVDYKRALLLYDKIYYLLPEQVVEFEDVDGTRRVLLFPEHLRRSPLFTVVHFEPDDAQRAVVQAAARHDADDPAFLSAIAAIPPAEQQYTWRLANSDGGLGGGTSMGLAPAQAALAQAMLLNKFLVAADTLGSAPITGQPYLHGLVGAKYRQCCSLYADLHVASGLPLRPDIAQSVHPVAVELASAFITDEELNRRTEEEILAYKAENRALFGEFTSEVLLLTASLNTLPGTREFEAALRHALQTTVWKKRSAIQAELRGAWESFFKASAKAAMGALLAMGVTPLPLVALVAGAAAATGTWAVSDCLDSLFKFRKARSNGYYYLMGFSPG